MDDDVCQVEDGLGHGPHEGVDTQNFHRSPETQRFAIRFGLQHEEETQEMK